MNVRRQGNGPSPRELRAAIDQIILESVDRDPAHVARALEAVVERCKAEGRYPEDQIDAAASQIRKELGLA